MPSMEEIQQTNCRRVLLIGESGAGKTGSLASLVNNGCKIHLIDLENNIEPLKVFSNPAFHKNIDVVSLVDKMEIGSAKYVPVKKDNKELGKVYKAMMPVGEPMTIAGIQRLLKFWDYCVTPEGELFLPKQSKGAEIPFEKEGNKKYLYGDTKLFKPNQVIVIDSLSAVVRAATNQVKFITGTNYGNHSYGEYAQMQGMINQFLETIRSMKCNVIVTAHVKHTTSENGAIIKGHANSIGKALDGIVPSFFDTVLLLENVEGKRVIRTGGANMDMVNLKLPSKEALTTYPLATGLFSILKSSLITQDEVTK